MTISATNKLLHFFWIPLQLPNISHKSFAKEVSVQLSPILIFRHEKTRSLQTY